MSERSLGRVSGQFRWRKAYGGAAGQEKWLVALAVEGKSAGEGLQTMDEDEDEDMLLAMAASWWRRIESGRPPTTGSPP